MIVSDGGQARVFLINIIFGMLCVILFDVFTVFVKKYGKNTLVINIFDALYFSLIFLLVLFAGIKFNFGALRYYQIIGLLSGIIFHMLFVSKAERILFEKLFTLAGNVFKGIFKIITFPLLFVLRVLYSVVVFLEDVIMKVCKRLKKIKEKVRLKIKKSKKNVKKKIKMI